MKSTTNGPTLFESASEGAKKAIPLAAKQRPLSFEGFFGQEKVFKRFPFLKGQDIPSLMLWGPPGSGKTTLAGILANHLERELFTFNAVLGGVNDLKKLIERAGETERYSGKKTIIFIDEIHRFNKAQQDALLPFVEDGSILLIGATTEPPKVSVNRALLSRTRIIELEKLSEEALTQILQNACREIKLEFPQETLDLIAHHSNGDARFALNTLEELTLLSERDPQTALDLMSGGNRTFDKNKDRHYDVISAFIKSVRGSDPQAALLYLAIMLDGGEDPMFIARRLIILASEDIGNADPQALTLAASTLTAVQHIGMPEARIPLAQTTTYLASTSKSNAAYVGINEALSFVKGQGTIEVPTHLRNHHPDKKNYRYPHNHPHHWVFQKYAIDGLPDFYRPTEQGLEAKIKARLNKLH